MIKNFRFAILLPLFLLFSLIALRAAYPEIPEAFQLKVFDLYQKFHPRPYQDVPVRIIDIDEESLKRLGQWPWPRTLLAQLIEKLNAAGVSTIGMDILFAEPDRTSAAEVIETWPSTPQLETIKPMLSSLPNHDEVFAKAMSEANVVTSYSLTHIKNDRVPLRKMTFAFAGDNPQDNLFNHVGAIVNLRPLEAAAKGNGSFNLDIGPTQDGVIRRVPLIFKLRDELYPSLAIEALRVAQDTKTIIIKSSTASGELNLEGKPQIVSLKIGDFAVPTDSRGRMLLYDTHYQKNRYVSAWRIIEDKIDPKELEGKIVFLGTSAEGLKDLRTTPLNPVVAGVQIHAQTIEQILLGEFLLQPDWAVGAEISFLFILGFLLILLLPRLGALPCAMMTLLACAGVSYFSWHLFVHQHLLVDPLWPCLVILAIYLLTSLLNFLQTESEKRFVRGAFSRYLSPAVVEQLASHPEKLQLGGQIRKMSFLFADIRNFTTLSEKFSAAELTQFMNHFLTPMTEIIMRHRGTIDKYMGDCIMAFWNAPLEDQDHAKHACEAALEMQVYLKHFTPPVKIGIGVNTGEGCVGNMGSDQRFDYSVLGDEVNLASRLEGQSKIYGVDIIFGENTHDFIKDHFAVLELDLIQVKGKTKPVRIFGLFGDIHMKDSKSFRDLILAHQKMIDAYRKKEWDIAESSARQALRSDLGMAVLNDFYQLYLQRIQTYKINPPALDWAGIYIATSK